jgi:hypothetical protein
MPGLQLYIYHFMLSNYSLVRVFGEGWYFNKGYKWSMTSLTLDDFMNKYKV